MKAEPFLEKCRFEQFGGGAKIFSRIGYSAAGLIIITGKGENEIYITNMRKGFYGNLFYMIIRLTTNNCQGQGQGQFLDKSLRAEFRPQI